MPDTAPMGGPAVDTSSHDRWLYAWATGYASVGGALASAVGPLVTFTLAAAVTVAGGAIGVYSARSSSPTATRSEENA